MRYNYQERRYMSNGLPSARVISFYLVLLSLSKRHPGEYFSMKRILSETARYLELRDPAFEDEVSTRQGRRYIESIRNSLAEVDVRYGPGGGYRIDDPQAPFNGFPVSDIEAISASMLGFPEAKEALRNVPGFSDALGSDIIGVPGFQEGELPKILSFMQAIKEGRGVVLKDYDLKRCKADLLGVPLSVLYFDCNLYFGMAYRDKNGTIAGKCYAPEKCSGVVMVDRPFEVAAEITQAYKDAEAVGANRISAKRIIKEFQAPVSERRKVRVAFSGKAKIIKTVESTDFYEVATYSEEEFAKRRRKIKYD